MCPFVGVLVLGGNWMRAFLKDIAGMLVLAFAFAFVFQTTAFATYFIPSESMVPTLQVGDRLTVSKFAYGWSRHSLAYDLELPASIKGRVLAGKPKRGDIIVFVHPRTSQRMIKRLIGLPGDKIALRGGRIVLNGNLVERSFVRSYRYREYAGSLVSVREYDEFLPGHVPHKIIERMERLGLRDMAEITIPQGRYFMMGDNRDNSADSRYPDMGLVPKENLIGRAEAILYTWYSCKPEPDTVCAKPRFATRLQ